MNLNQHLEAIRRHPDDAELYLVLGDWLQEQNDPWGELIILQHQLEQQPGNSAISDEAEALMKKQGWTRPDKPENLRLDWRWGFLRHVRVYDRFDDYDINKLTDWLSALPMIRLLETLFVFRDGRFADSTEVEQIKRKLPPETQVEVIRPVDADAEDGPPVGEVRWLSIDRARVPADLGRYSQLRFLTWHRARRLPTSLGKLPLERLDLNWSFQLKEIPDALWGIESLGYMSLYDCTDLNLNMGQVNNLLSGFVRARTPRAQRIVEAGLMQGKKPARVTTEQLLLALDNNVKVVRQAAIEQLGQLKNPLARRPLGKGSVIALLGSFNLDRKTLKQRLEACGVKVVTKVSAKTTHVLLGEKPKGKHLLEPASGLPQLVEGQLIDALKGSGESVVEDATDEAALAKGLRSKNDKQIVEAVAKLQELGGVPKTLLPELFCVHQDTSLKGKGRTHAKRLFAAYAPQGLQKVVSRHFKTSALLAGETKRNERLAALEKQAGRHIDVLRVVRLFVEDHGAGHTYLFGKGDSERDWALAKLISGKTVRFHHMEMDELPDLSGFPELTEVDALDNHLTRFPKNLPTSIETLSLRANYLRSLPRNLSAYDNLRVLDLAHNRFASFPKGVVTLPALEKLDLSSDTWGETRITSIPAVIVELTRLREVNIENGRQAVEVPPEMAQMKWLKELRITWKGTAKTPPAALRKLLPHCKIR